jgi:hypothetical protein
MGERLLKEDVPAGRFNFSDGPAPQMLYLERAD